MNKLIGGTSLSLVRFNSGITESNLSRGLSQINEMITNSTNTATNSNIP